MTTIAYKDGVMAADGLVCGSDLRRGSNTKITRLIDGTLIGCCGSSAAIVRFQRWAHAGFDMANLPTFDKDHGVAAIVVHPNMKVEVWHSECLEPQSILPPPWGMAMGSGNEVALGAMAMGADARRAIEIAIMIDTASGGDIQVERIDRLSSDLMPMDGGWMK